MSDMDIEMSQPADGDAVVRPDSRGASRSVPARPASTAIRLKRVAPPEAREAIVQLFWRMQAWPYATEEEYFRYWDWRYSSTSESPPAVWVALADDRVVAQLAVNFRHFQVAGRPVEVGVPANFLVDDQYRKMMIGPLLVKAAQRMVRKGEIDLLLSYSNRTAHAISVALGSKDIGSMQSFVEVRRWAPVLGRRYPGGALLAPLAGAAAKLRKRLRSRDPLEHPEEFVVRDLTAEELASMDRTHWAQSSGLVWNGSGDYLANRFLRCPFREYRVAGIVQKSSGRLEAILITEGAARLYVTLCAANEAVLSDVEAVELLARARPDVEVVVVPLLPQTALASEFLAAGFLARSGPDADSVVQRTFWSAYWAPGHPLASYFERWEAWKLWYAWNQH